MLTSKGGLKPGVKVTIGGEEYTAPQMNFGSIREMANLDRQSRSFVNDLLGFVLMESLKRNYDGVNAVWLNETLEGSEMDGAATAELEIMRASGLIKADVVPGEAPAVMG